MRGVISAIFAASCLLLGLALLFVACAGGSNQPGISLSMVLPDGQTLDPGKLLILVATPPDQLNGEILLFKVGSSDDDTLSFSLDGSLLINNDLDSSDLHLLVYADTGNLVAPCVRENTSCNGSNILPEKIFSAPFGPNSQSPVTMDIQPLNAVLLLAERILFGAADADGDGFSPPQDCNDNDPQVHPQALEDCFSIQDRNCDGNTDEGCNLTSLSSVKVTSSVIVDGALTEADWENADFINFSNPGKSDNLVQVLTLWDNANLYFAYRVEDPDLQAANDPTHVYHDDGTEIYLDIGHLGGVTTDGNDYHFMSNIDDLFATSPLVNMQVATTTTANGFVSEIAIPLDEVGLLPVPDQLVGLLLGNNDREYDDYVQYDWMNIADRTPPDNGYAQPFLWGDLLIVP